MSRQPNRCPTMTPRLTVGPLTSTGMPLARIAAGRKPPARKPTQSTIESRRGFEPARPRGAGAPRSAFQTQMRAIWFPHSVTRGVHPGAHPPRLSTAAAHSAPEPHDGEPPPIAARSRWFRCRACAEPRSAARRQHFTSLDAFDCVYFGNCEQQKVIVGSVLVPLVTLASIVTDVSTFTLYR
jgi:hypothetical protein